MGSKDHNLKDLRRMITLGISRIDVLSIWSISWRFDDQETQDIYNIVARLTSMDLFMLNYYISEFPCVIQQSLKCVDMLRKKR